MLTRDEHEGFVRHLYAAAAGDVEWPAVLARFADRFGHSAAVLTMLDRQQGVLRAQAHGTSSADADAYYQSETFRRDPRAAIHMSVTPGQIYHDRRLYDVDAMLRDPRVRDSIDAIGVAHQLGVSLRLAHGAPGVLALLSTEREGMPSADAVTAFERLAPHIEQACALGEILERNASTQAALLQALAEKADGVMLLDMEGRPGFANDGARAILAAGDGLGWTDGNFVTARGAETRRLRGAIQGAIAGRTAASGAMAGGQLLVTRPSGLSPYIVRVLPAPPIERMLARFGFGCVLHIHDLAAERVPPRGLLQAVFGLTHREADLAIELVRCAGLPAAAARAGMAHNTARNHLQNLFRKCGVASQAEVVRLFSRLA